MVVVVAQITFYVSKLQHLYMYITYKNLSKLTKGSQWLIWMQYYLNTDITVFIYLIPKKLTLIVVATTHLIVE